MALNKTNLKADIKQAFIDQQNKTSDPASALDDLSQKIADAIDVYVKGGTVTVAAPIPVQVVPATGTGGTTAPAIGTIS